MTHGLLMDACRIAGALAAVAVAYMVRPVRQARMAETNVDP